MGSIRFTYVPKLLSTGVDITSETMGFNRGKELIPIVNRSKPGACFKSKGGLKRSAMKNPESRRVIFVRNYNGEYFGYFVI